jgi:hypothetical protein
MKEATIKRINKIVINYMSIMGLWNQKKLDKQNPILIYFITNILANNPNVFNQNGILIAEGTLENTNQYLTLNIPRSFFHIMIKEFYHIYEKLDEIDKNQNEEIKQTLIQFIGSEHSFKEYINSIMYQYRESFYDLIKNYNSHNTEYNSIKIKVLNDKMIECVQEEDYMQAAEIRDKIKSLKE